MWPISKIKGLIFNWDWDRERLVIGGLFGVKQSLVQIDAEKSVLFGLLVAVILVYFLLSISIFLLHLTVFLFKISISQ